MEKRNLPISSRIKERKNKHKQKNPLVRFGWFTLGVLTTVVGIIMIITPGPAFVLIPLGLGLMAMEWSFAEKMLERAEIMALNAKTKATKPKTPQQKILIVLVLGIAVLAIALVCLTTNLPTNFLNAIKQRF